MRNYVNIFLLVCIVNACTHKQENHASEKKASKRQLSIEMLLQELPKAKEDTNKVNLLNDLSIAYSKTAFDKAIQYGQAGLILSEKLKWQSGMAQSSENLGMVNTTKADFPNAKKYLEQALKIYKALADKTGTARGLLNLGELYHAQADYTKALEYHFRALKLFEALADRNGKASALGKIGMAYFYLFEPKTLDYLNKALEMNTALGNKSEMAENLRFIGNVYNHRLNDHRTGLEYFLKSLRIEEELGDTYHIAKNMISIGISYAGLHDHIKELDYKFQALNIFKQLGAKRAIANAYGNLGWAYYGMGADTCTRITLDPTFTKYHIQNKRQSLLKSRAYMDTAGKAFFDLGEPDNETYFVISLIDSILGNYKDAFVNYRKSVAAKEFMFSRDNTKSITQMQLNYEYDKKEIEAKAEQERKQIVQRNIRNTIIGGLIAALLVMVVVIRQRNRTMEEKKRSDNLLLNILPEEVAEELKSTGRAEARQFDQVTVLFTDFKDFTKVSEKLTAKELVEEIHACFKAFDEITEKYGIEKIKTIGDSYMCAGGLPVANNTHAEDVVNAALEIQQFIDRRMSEKTASGEEAFHVRIGIHTGPVVAGIVGIKKFAYDIWGDTVNTASRIESSGEAGKVNISGTTYELVKTRFNCTHRGKIQAKGKGEIDMYFVEGRI